MAKKTVKFSDLDGKTKKSIEKEASNKGIDPEKLKDMSFDIDTESRMIKLKYNDIEISVPAPSQEEVDNFFRKHGGTIVSVAAGAAIALASAAVGAAIKD